VEQGEPLSGGWSTDVRRVGDVVLRSARPHSRTVLALLTHLHEHGFDAAPRPVDGGFSDDGREQITYLEGASPHPKMWSEEGAWELGRMLRQMHDAASSFQPKGDTAWSWWFGRDLPGRCPVIGHGDLGPWNILGVDGKPVAFIDWDNAGPVDASWEVAAVAWTNAQLYDDDVAALNDLPDAAGRIRQCALIIDGYGLERAERTDFVDRMIEYAVRSARDEAQVRQVTPTTTSPAADGWPTLWAVVWRARSAAWMLDHRSTLEQAIRL
jgi:Ser/Thr protein kinase RdoA (MazF antagonist)